ncbi:MAG: DUF3857 domain-containing protein [Lewinellaceae bacterium]|nr:DUF3857 domain-containing protein [Lewinellaceae bacterium]
MKTLSWFFFLLPVYVVGQNNYAASLIDPTLLENANAVIRLQKMDFYVKQPGEAVKKETLVVTLLNDKSRYNELRLFYDSFNKIKKVGGKIYDAQGKLVREVEKKEIQDMSAISNFSIYEDNRIRYVEVKYSEYPYTVEFEYEMNYNDLFGYPDWDIQPYNVSVEQSEHFISLPEGMKLLYKPLNTEIEPMMSSAGGRTIYYWSARQVPAIKYEPYSPPAAEILPSVLISPETFEVENYTGSMATWKEFGRFMNKLSEGRDVLSPAMRSTVAELTKNVSTDREKIEKLYRYLQENMRYVSVQLGLGGWQPFDANYVEQNKYGDCKALSNFMKAMLKEAGIKAWPVLIYSGDLYYDISEDFATNAFNHVIIYVPSENLWLECTSSTAPPNYLSSSCTNRNVLLITEDGGKIDRTPNYSTEGNFKRTRANVELEPSGAAAVGVEVERKGSKQEWYRYAARQYSSEEFNKKFQEYSPLPGFNLKELRLDVKKDIPEVGVHFLADVPAYASRAGKRLFVPLNKVNPFTSVPQADEHRLHPVEVRDGYSETDNLAIKIPEGYKVESMPGEPVSLATPYGTYYLKVWEEDGYIKVDRNLEVMPVRLAAEEYGAWRDFYKSVSLAEGTTLVLVEKKT